MCAVLVTFAEVAGYLGQKESFAGDFADADAWKTFIDGLTDRVEALLEAECNVSFAAEAAYTNEPHDGTGTPIIYADHPIKTLTSVKVGIDASSPDTEYTSQPDDVDFHGARIMLRGGIGATEPYYGVFPVGLKNVYITYTGEAYAPAVAKQAVLEGVAFLYRRRGHEHLVSESVGEMGSLQSAARFDFLPAWKRAVATLRVPVIV